MSGTSGSTRRLLRRLIAIGALTLITSAGAHGVVVGRQAPVVAHAIHGFEKFQSWARSVQAHEPGTWDDAARSIAGLPPADLRNIAVDLAHLVELLRDAKAGRKAIVYPDPTFSAGRDATLDREIDLNAVPVLLAIPDDGWSVNLGRAQNATGDSVRGGTDFEVALRRLEREVTRFAKLAATVHADIAVVATLRGDLSAPLPFGEPRADVMRVGDGLTLGNAAEPVHWEIARVVLDVVQPDPAADEFVPVWYRATSAFMLRERQYGYVLPHLKHGRALLPRDARLEFDQGVLEENLTAPPVQVPVLDLEARGIHFNATSLRDQLTSAGAHFARALELDAGMSEARMRRGRVLGLLGRHAEAAAELRSAMPSLDRDSVRYDAALFLGAEAHALRDLDAATSAFEQAHAWRPRAQSPVLALGQIASERGQIAQAVALLRQLSALPASETERPDPWWTYDIAPFEDADRLLAEMRAAALVVKRS